MARYVPDVQTHRWVIISPGRTRRPHVVSPSTSLGVSESKLPQCVFCYGGESMSGSEIYRLGEGAPNSVGGWRVRVISNKYPITDFHEVIIHSPDEEKDVDQLSPKQVFDLLAVYRHRFTEHQKSGRVLIFCNHGEDAGASIHHPHSQLVVLPSQINLDSLELEPIENVVMEDSLFTVYCPEFSQWPYETWIAPKRKGTTFGEATDEELTALTAALQTVLQRLIAHLSASDHSHSGVPAVTKEKGLSYNYYIHHDKNWYLRIIPRLIHRAGFELGTGLSVNIMDPLRAAEILKGGGER